MAGPQATSDECPSRIDSQLIGTQSVDGRAGQGEWSGTVAEIVQANGIVALLSGERASPTGPSHVSCHNDTIYDLFDPDGNGKAGQAYLDITAITIALEDPFYRIDIDVLGLVPGSISDPPTFIEWGLLIDLDRDRSTRPWGNWPLLDNGLGVDALVRVTLGQNGFAGEVWTWPGGGGRLAEAPFTVDGASLGLQFNASAIGSPAVFDYVVAVREYVENRLTTLDKWPNQGYATFPVGEQMLVASILLLLILVRGVVVLMNA